MPRKHSENFDEISDKPRPAVLAVAAFAIAASIGLTYVSAELTQKDQATKGATKEPTITP